MPLDILVAVVSQEQQQVSLIKSRSSAEQRWCLGQQQSSIRIPAVMAWTLVTSQNESTRKDTSTFGGMSATFSAFVVGSSVVRVTRRNGSPDALW